MSTYVKYLGPQLTSGAGGGGGSGNVVGPNSSTTNGIPVYSDTTGKLLSSTDITITGIPTNNWTFGPVDTSSLSIACKDGTAAQGGALIIRSGSSSGNLGGSIRILSGDGFSSGRGRDLDIIAGDNLSTGPGSNVVLQPGSGDTGAGGDLWLYSGSSNSGPAGNVFIASTNDQNPAVTVDANNNVIIGSGALATTATDGFLYIPTQAGTPTGVPTSVTGSVAMTYDTTTNFLYVYNGAWKKVAFI